MMQQIGKFYENESKSLTRKLICSYCNNPLKATPTTPLEKSTRIKCVCVISNILMLLSVLTAVLRSTGDQYFVV